MAKIEFDINKLNKTEKELYSILPAEKKSAFEKKWIAKISAEKALKDMQLQSKRDARKQVDRNKYILGGLLMKYCGGKTVWTDEEIGMVEKYLEQYQGAIKSSIGKANSQINDMESVGGESKG